MYIAYVHTSSMYSRRDSTVSHLDLFLSPPDTAANAVLLSHILDLLSECIERHSYHIRNYIIDKNLLARVLVLMTSTHGHLVLCEFVGGEGVCMGGECVCVCVCVCACMYMCWELMFKWHTQLP